ncbi:DoxX family protein [Rhodoblastus acidophilus]|uniref:DoxX family protein n=1 Tax=Candidatus Rhodoblastus alkanivorans TaxID=2954117 RepID=A0ABS9ZA16_9HYPH|nr:DoxX family protein [Candidatus Rhodoblastus alkanivorans]MCI4679814.1 DoxX family protein [Candidatus Rhodoblastus alkanivorans]MCI4684320.1 DoxX family protein [Candidatus Rhodoblastus alkanivorans]MDI4641641.1 DoxX family protein [Rhodoblastus acidophilus]
MTASTALFPIELPLWRTARPYLVSLAQLALRIALAIPFYRSGITKWDGFLQLSDSADALFTDEFKLHLFGGEYPFPAPHYMALASGVMEVVLPVLLVFGLGTRAAALGLLGMTAIIQLTEPQGWANFHLIWAATALALFVHGPGKVSLDALIGKGLAGLRN